MGNKTSSANTTTTVRPPIKFPDFSGLFKTDRPKTTTLTTKNPPYLISNTTISISTLTTESPTTPGMKMTSNETSSSGKMVEIFAYTSSAIVIIMVFLILVRIYRRKKQQQQQLDNLDLKQLDDVSLKPWREIDKGFIATGKVLGSGFFGVVLQGTVILDGQSKQCAVKMLKDSATEADNKDLLNELQIISRIGQHPNIINLIGACTKSGPAHIVLEFAANGNLLDYLRENQSRDPNYTNVTSLRPDSTKVDLRTRLKIAYEVAQGMKHLSSKKCVHRDLAARNILLDEHFVAKVTDFGLSRDVYEKGVYEVNTQSKMPLKWMALESLETMVFTTQSDVWSFAVLMWEIETSGTTPYPGLMGRELFHDLSQGHRLEQPPSCPDNLYELMSKCWITDPSERPSFQQLCNELELFLQEEAGYEDLLMAAVEEGTQPNEHDKKEDVEQ